MLSFGGASLVTNRVCLVAVVQVSPFKPRVVPNIASRAVWASLAKRARRVGTPRVAACGWMVTTHAGSCNTFPHVWAAIIPCNALRPVEASFAFATASCRDSTARWSSIIKAGAARRGIVAIIV